MKPFFYPALKPFHSSSCLWVLISFQIMVPDSFAQGDSEITIIFIWLFFIYVHGSSNEWLSVDKYRHDPFPRVRGGVDATWLYSNVCSMNPQPSTCLSVSEHEGLGVEGEQWNSHLSQDPRGWCKNGETTSNWEGWCQEPTSSQRHTKQTEQRGSSSCCEMSKHH